MNDSASVTSSSLAVAEKTHRGYGGCVGVFFQLFDWNRRLTKKKLFSKRLLPPDRAKEASKMFRGDEKQPKLRLIANENSGGFPNKNKNGVNGVQTPTLVARLMGLESMPPYRHRDKLQEDNSGEFRGGRREKVAGDYHVFEKESRSHELRPQKLQKTGMVDRRSVSRFGAEALQLKNVLSQSRKHHHPKLASPVKSTGHHPKRNASRLMGAATRILEPGLQGRNRSRYSIGYGQAARRPQGNGLRSEPMNGEGLGLLSSPASCRNCGNLIDIAESTSKRDVQTSVFDSVSPSQASLNSSDSRYDQERECSIDGVSVDRGRWHFTDQHAPSAYCKESNRDQLKLNCFPYSSDTRDFVALNRGLSGCTRSRVPAKDGDMKFDTSGKFERTRVNCSSPRQKRQVTRTRRQGESCGVDSFSVNRLVWQPDFQGQIGNNNSDDGIAFRFNSPTKNRCEVPRKVKVERGGNNLNASPCKTDSRKRFTSNPSDEMISMQKPFSSTLGAYGSRINRNHFRHHHSCRLDHCSSFCLQPMKSEKVDELTRAKNSDHHSPGLTRAKNSDHHSPGSVLEASFSNDSCCSSSLEDSSVRTQHVDSLSHSYDDESQFQESETDLFYSHVMLRKENTRNKFVADLLTYISQVLCSMDLVNLRINGNIKEVIFNSELVLCNQMTHNATEINSFFICDLILELDTLADVMRTRCGNFLGSQNSGCQLKRFVFDSLIEYLESKYVPYAKCGFREWMNLPRFMGFDDLVRDVVEEVREWMGVTSDEPQVEMDMNEKGHCSGKWTEFEIEVYELGDKVERDIVQTLINEVVIDISTRIGILREVILLGGTNEDGSRSNICTE